MRRWAVSCFVFALLSSAVPAGAQLPEAGSISGTLTNSGGDAISGICVEANSEDWTWYSDETAEDGTYQIDVPSGRYRVVFYDCGPDPTYVTEWYDDKPDYYSADPIDVGGTHVSGIDAVLTVGGSITGTVTNEADEPIEDICVYAETGDYPFAWGSGYTDSSGSYTIAGLAAGSYFVSFHDCFQQRYQSEYYDDAQRWEDADLVDVAVETTVPGIDAVLAMPVPFDLVLSKLEVENVPLRTDNGEIGYTGMARTISVTVSNVGPGTGSGDLHLSICPATTGHCRLLHGGDVTVGNGETVTKKVTWNGAGMVGDVRIYADLYPWGYEEDWSNNFGQIDHYVLVGGTGWGAGL